jgi:VWFA-related protein
MRKIIPLAGLLLLATAVLAQIKVDVRLVNVVATVTDLQGRYVEGLKASDFTLKEDGKIQEIAHFTYSNDLPVSVGIVLDTSTSMERKIATATRAVDRFLRTIHEDDDIFLMTFDQSVRVRQDFTSDREKLWAALDKVKLGPGTSLYDAVIAGVERMRRGEHPKKAVLLISDGVDTTSERGEEVARLAVRESEILLYALGISAEGGLTGPMSERNPTVIIPGGSGDPRNPGRRNPGGGTTIPIPLPGGGNLPYPIPLPGPGRRQFPTGGGRNASIDTVDMQVLETFADESGGRAWLITPDNRRNRLQDALDEIADELRNQYSLGYYPGHDLKDGKWHRIELTLRNSSYNVRYREEYVGR